MSTDSSAFDKLLRGRAGTQIAIWNQAESWSGPLREYAKVSAAVRVASGLAESVGGAAESIERRLQFLAWEARAIIDSQRQDFTGSQLLRAIFFERLGFQVSASADSLLDVALGRRRCPPRLGAMLFAWFGELVADAYGDTCDFRRIDLVASVPLHVVRLVSADPLASVVLLDLEDAGNKIAEAAWVPWCDGSGFVRLGWTKGLLLALQDLLTNLQPLSQPQAQIVVLDHLIALEPSQTRRWAERARLFQQSGQSNRALEDLKRFFAFNNRDTAPNDVVALYDALQSETHL